MHKLKRFLIPSIAGIVLFFLLFSLRYGQDHYVADSFWVTGVSLILFTGLIFVANEGVFDMVVYGTKRFVDLFRKEKRVVMTYHEYVVSKQEKEKVSLWPTAAVGAIFFIIGLILSLLV